MDPRAPHFHGGGSVGGRGRGRGRSRYDPFTPSHHFADHAPPPEYYPHPQFHPPPPPPTRGPPPRQHRGPHPDDPGVYFQHHHPPIYDPRVSDPRASDRVLVHGPHHQPHEPWDDVGPRKIRVFDDQLDWEGERQGNPHPTRLRIREDGILEEDFRDRVHRQQQQSRVRVREEQIFDDEYMCQAPVPPPVPLRAHAHQPYCDAEVTAEFDSANLMGAYAGDEGVEDVFHENHYVGKKGKRKWVGMGNEDVGFQESHYMGNKGKRKIFNGGSSQFNDWGPTKRPGQKTSALGRIQSGVSVWSRLEEKRSSPHPNDFVDIGDLDENQTEVDSLDLSYKSNALVAKVVLPSSPELHEFQEGSSPKVVITKDRIKEIKKVDKDREKVVIPIVSRLIRVPKKSVSSSPPGSNRSERLKKGVVCSSKCAGDGSKAVVSSRRAGNEGSKQPTAFSAEPAIEGLDKLSGSSGEPAGDETKTASGGTKKIVGSSFKPARAGVKKEMSCSSEPGNETKKSVVFSTKSASGGIKKAVGSSSKPARARVKKEMSCSSEPASHGPKRVSTPGTPLTKRVKKITCSSNKLAGGASSQPSKKVVKVASSKKIVAKKVVKTVKKSTSDGCGKTDRVGETNPISEQCQLGPTVLTSSTKHIDLEPHVRDSNLVHRPKIKMESIENSATESIKDGISVVTSNEDTAVELHAKDSKLVPSPIIGMASSEKITMELSSKDVNLVENPMVVSSSIKCIGAEQSSDDVSSVQGNVVAGFIQEELVMPAEKIHQSSANPVVSDTGIVIDIISESAPEVNIIMPDDLSPTDDTRTVVTAKKDAHAIMGGGRSSKSDREHDMPSFRESTSFGLVSDAQVMDQFTLPFDTVTASSFVDSIKDEIMNREIEEVQAQHNLDVPSDKDEFVIISDRDARVASDAGALVWDQSFPDGAMHKKDFDVRLPSRAGLLQSSNMPNLEDSSVASVKDSASERMDQLLPFNLSENGISLDSVSRTEAEPALTCETQFNSQLAENGNKNDNNNKQVERPISDSESLFAAKCSLMSKIDRDTESNKNLQIRHPVLEKTRIFQAYDPKKKISENVKLSALPKSMKPVLSSGVPRVSVKQLTSAGSLNETSRSSHSARNKTWHRTDVPSASALQGNLQSAAGSYKLSVKKLSPKKMGRLQNASYVRKGNSLIRKPANVIPAPMLPYVLDSSSRKSKSTERMINSSTHKTFLNPSIERPRTPPLPLGSKLNCDIDPQKECPPPTSEDPSTELGVESNGKQVESQTVDLLSGTMDNLNIAGGVKSETLARKRMIYVKHKSNQLIAAPRPGCGDPSTHAADNVEKLPSTSSDLYYMRKKNQLILNALSSDSQRKQDILVPVDNSNPTDYGASKFSSLECSRTGLLKKRLDKVSMKAHKHSRFSRVWTLDGGQSGKKGSASVNCWKVMPYLFPWKRTPYCKFSLRRNKLQSAVRPLSSISRKLQLTRKRDTIYTVSTDGFSLQKAGVVSIGGSSLKWSKSMDKHSKKANEEATLAVAEVERKKRERKIRRPVGARAKSRNCFMRKSTVGVELLQGERIFRVGSVRYKMDASKRVLIRIPDEQSPEVIEQQSGSSTFVPRRLLIGNDEYVRIGNGNKLVRDPKKLVRILASEKVRWSLHTARLRLAKKQQYCQFFTRFGKCNKNSGKCPYIHDPEKVAICTKFLRSVCADVNCKLTHKIIPERMPDCSYFLQGLCTNVNCPYRHVHVNPNASICDGFLKGFCADGDECRRKHSYVCPLFEATGKCPQGSKCKLHHPKSKNKSKKRKRSSMHGNTMGRYFCSKIIKLSEPVAVASQKYSMEEGEDPFFADGRFAEFISIDSFSDNDDDDMNDLKDDNSKEADSDVADMLSDELDELIKPVRIMNRTNLGNASISC